MIFEKKRENNSGMNVFDEMGKYWTEIADRNSTEKQIQFIRKTLKINGLVLDLACGTGRHIIPLSEEGYNMVGLDVSSNLLKIAKNREGSVQLIKADMRFLPFRLQTFSAVISIDTSFGYLSSERDDIQSLKEIREVLSQDDEFIIDVFNRERQILKYKPRKLKNLKWAFLPILLKPNRLAKWMLFRFFKWKEYPSFFLLQKRKVDANGERLHDLWLIYDKADGQVRIFDHHVRLYEFKRLQMLLEQAGFTVNAVYGDYDQQSFSPSSSRLILVASSE